MGITRAIERVKRRAKLGGLNGVIAGLGHELRAGLGHELRSSAIPRPLRGAAERLAAFLEPTAQVQQTVYEAHYEVRPPAPVTSGESTMASAAVVAARAANESVASSSSESAEREPAASALEDVVVSAPALSDAPPSYEGVSDEDAASVPLSIPVEALPSESEPRMRAEVSAIGVDAGDEPGERALDPGTPVDAEAVGAIPSVNATPVEAAVIDATPVDVAAVDATPREVVTIDAKDDVAGSDEPASADAPSEPEAIEASRADEGESDEAERDEPESAQAHDDGDEPAGSVESEEARGDDGGEHAEVAHEAPADAEPAEPVEAQANSRVADEVPGRPATRQKGRTQGSRRRGGSTHSSGSLQNEKEKLAADEGQANSLARSGSRASKRRTRARADTTSKKK